MKREFIHKILTNPEKVSEAEMLEIFHFQYDNNTVYRQFTDAIQPAKRNLTAAQEIPFLPIRFFKTHAVASGRFEPEAVFESSGTTGTLNSQHLVNQTDNA